MRTTKNKTKNGIHVRVVYVLIQDLHNAPCCSWSFVLHKQKEKGVEPLCNAAAATATEISTKSEWGFYLV